MSEQTRPFTRFVRENRELSAHLDRNLRSLVDAIRELRTVADVEDFTAHRLPGMLDAAYVQPPEIGALQPSSVDAPVSMALEDGTRPFVAQHRTTFEVHGDGGTLRYWPDDAPQLLAADEPPSATESLTVDNADDVWQLRGPDDKGKYLLSTSLYLTREEEASRPDVTGMVVARRRRIEPILEAIAEQVASFNETLPARVGEALNGMRQEFEAREGVTRSFDFPPEWHADVPVLETFEEASLAGSGGGESDRASIEQRGLYGDHLRLEDIDMPMTARLAPRSFEQIQRIIRIWANSVERYPRAFAGLHEDPISDLLAATLNATLPGANREVYSHSGKSDIFVRADILDEGSGDENVLIIESKWATSKGVVHKALDPQLFGYLTATDTAAVLLLLMPQKHFHSSRNTYRTHLRGVDGYVREETSAVTEWPIFVFKRDGRTVRICIATVHLPRTARSS